MFRVLFFCRLPSRRRLVVVDIPDVTIAFRLGGGPRRPAQCASGLEGGAPWLSDQKTFRDARWQCFVSASARVAALQAPQDPRASVRGIVECSRALFSAVVDVARATAS